MADISLSRRIDAPIEKVWSAITDLERSAETISSILKIERLGAGSGFDVGTRWRETRKFFGKQATEEMEVTAIEPLRSYVVKADSHKVHYISEFSVEEAGGQTLLSMTFDAEPQGPLTKLMAETVGRLMKGATRKALQKDLDEIAKAVED